MKYDVYLSTRAQKQFKKLDGHIRSKIRAELIALEKEPAEESPS